MMHNQLRSIACWQMMHKVSVPEESTSCLPCRVNPMGLICTCKQARKTGICHAIVAVNHRCGKINIASELMKMGKKKKKKAVHRATGRRQMQPESSSDSETDEQQTLSDLPTSSDED